MNSSELNTTTTPGINRRKIVKGAAWSLPVIATAIAAPSAAASTTPAWDARVSGTCSGQFKAAGLASNILNALTGALGLTAATRSFTITAQEGTIPAGTQFQLNHGGLLNLNLLGWSALGLTLLSSGPVATLALVNPLPLGQSITIDLLVGLADVRVASNMSLSLAGADNPSSASPGANSASIRTTLGTTVRVLGLVNVNLQVCGWRTHPAS